VTAVAEPLPVAGRQPGVYPDITADEYHADRESLSSTGARKLLPPSCPAKFKWDLDHPPAPRKAFDVGTAAHKLVLGDGPELVVPGGGRERWDTADVKAEIAEIRARGAVPLKQAEYDAVTAMAAAIRQHPVAAALFDPERGGKPEQSLYWNDQRTGVQCRARLDWLPATDGGRLIAADLKTCVSADPKAFNRAVHEYRYDAQDQWYRSGMEAVGLAEDPAFVFVLIEKTPPYLVNVIELSTMWRLMAEDRNHRARTIYARCKERDVWPGYGTDVDMVAPPAWLETEHEREYH